MAANWPATVLFIGCGNMGGAMLTGWLRGGVPAERFTVYDPFLASAPDGVELLRELPEGRVFDLMILGVKPQMLDGVAGALTALAGPIRWFSRCWPVSKWPAFRCVSLMRAVGAGHAQPCGCLGQIADRRCRDGDG
jgi:hypothetical protein